MHRGRAPKEREDGGDLREGMYDEQETGGCERYVQSKEMVKRNT